MNTSKLSTQEQKDEFIRLYSEGWGTRRLATHFRMGETTARMWVLRLCQHVHNRPKLPPVYTTPLKREEKVCELWGKVKDRLTLMKMLHMGGSTLKKIEKKYNLPEWKTVNTKLSSKKEEFIERYNSGKERISDLAIEFGYSDAHHLRRAMEREGILRTKEPGEFSRYHNDVIENVRVMREQKKTQVEIARKTGVSPRTQTQLARKHGWPLFAKNYTRKINYDKIKELWLEGVPTLQIAIQLKCNRGTVAWVARKLGLPSRPDGKAMAKLGIHPMSKKLHTQMMTGSSRKKKRHDDNDYYINENDYIDFGRSRPAA